MSSAAASRFAFSLFDRELTGAIASGFEDFSPTRMIKTPTYRYQLGRVLEHRLLIGLGGQCGLFPVEVAELRLRRNEDVLREALGALPDDERARLPAMIDSAVLLAQWNLRTEDVDDFRSYLTFRRTFLARRARYYHVRQLFLPDDQWDTFLAEMAEAARVATSLLRGQKGEAEIDAALESFRSVADIYQFASGTINSGDDFWGLGESRAFVPYPPPSAQSLFKDGPRRVRFALDSAVSVSNSLDSSLRAGGKEIASDFLQCKLAYICHVRFDQHRAVLSPPPDMVELMSATDDSLLVNYIGPSLCWGALLWRFAPTDRRSLERVSVVRSLLENALSVS